VIAITPRNVVHVVIGFGARGWLADMVIELDAGVVLVSDSREQAHERRTAGAARSADTCVRSTYRIKRCRLALFEIARPENTCAKLRKRAHLSQCKTTHLFCGPFLARCFHLPPIVLSVPASIRPMLHLIGHPVSPDFRNPSEARWPALRLSMGSGLISNPTNIEMIVCRHSLMLS
jgi:hypothetical protein